MTSFRSDQPYNQLPLLPSPREQIETLPILRQESRAVRALAELKGMTRLLPNPAILVDALVVKRNPTDTATKEVLRYRQALNIAKPGKLNPGLFPDDISQLDTKPFKVG